MTGQPRSQASALDHDVRFYVFRQAADTARVPSPGEIAAALGRPQPDIEESLRRLAAGHVLILAPGTANIWAADPFCAVPSNFRVNALDRTYWGICIWDALGVLAALNSHGTVTASCGDCGQNIVLEVRDGALIRSEGIVHFGVPAAQWWDNIAFT